MLSDLLDLSFSQPNFSGSHDIGRCPSTFCHKASQEWALITFSMNDPSLRGSMARFEGDARPFPFFSPQTSSLVFDMLLLFYMPVKDALGLIFSDVPEIIRGFGSFNNHTPSLR